MTSLFSKDLICDMCDNVGPTKIIRVLTGMQFIPNDRTIQFIFDDVQLCIPYIEEHRKMCSNIGALIAEHSAYVFDKSGIEVRADKKCVV